MNVRNVFLIVILLGVCWLIGCRSSLPACTPDPDKNRIIFVSTEGGGWDIYTMNADGTCKTRLTHTARDEYKPIWSPDGTQILFEGISSFSQHRNLYVMDADGSHTTLLARQGSYATWSPDGTQIAFVSHRDGLGMSTIYVMNADGSHQTRLVDFEIGPVGPIWKPSWSPDGQQIVFSTPERGGDIYVANADGSGARNLTDNPDETSQVPIWSPDGKYILFELISNTQRSDEIWIMNADGSNAQRLLTKSSVYGRIWGWGPDEKSVSIEAALDRWELHIIEVDCVLEHPLGRDSLPESCYSRISLPEWVCAPGPGGWSSDGTLLVFEVVEVDEQKCNDQGRGCEDNEICTIRADGTGFVNLTDNVDLDSDPTWSP